MRIVKMIIGYLLITISIILSVMCLFVLLQASGMYSEKIDNNAITGGSQLLGFLGGLFVFGVIAYLTAIAGLKLIKQEKVEKEVDEE